MEYFIFSKYEFYKWATESKHGECIDIISVGFVIVLGSLQEVENMLSNHSFPPLQSQNDKLVTDDIYLHRSILTPWYTKPKRMK